MSARVMSSVKNGSQVAAGVASATSRRKSSLACSICARTAARSRAAGAGAGSAAGGMAVAGDGGGNRDGEQAEQPGGGFDGRAGGGAAEAQGAQGTGDDGDGVGPGEGLQPAGHGGDRDQGGTGEEQDDDGEQSGQPGRFGVADSQAEQQVEPGERQPGRDRQGDGGQGGGGPGVEPEPDRGTDGGHQPDDEQVAQGIGDDPAGQHRAAADGQGPEPVDHAGGQVLGDGHSGLRGAEPDRQHEDTRQQVVDVAGRPGRVDGPAEGVGEQQHEQHRLHGGEDQQGGHPDQPAQVPPGDGGDIRQHRGGPVRQGGGTGGGDHRVLRIRCAGRAVAAGGPVASCSGSCVRLGGGPVSARNASSRVGRRRASPLTCRPAAARRAATSGRIPGPPATGSTTRPAASSMAGSAVPSADSAPASCRGSWPGGDCRSSRSPPARAWSWPGVPLAMTWPWSMMTIMLASRSASSMYWVVSSMLVPRAVSSPRTCHSARRPRGSSPVVGSSRNRTGGAASRLAATSSRRRIP